MIAWLRENIDFGTFTLGPHEPPLAFDDGFFDLVINHSVFTHIDERLQDLWLAELQRITCQGAILLLTVQSLDTWNRTLELIRNGGENLERFRNGLESRGILFIAEDHFAGSTHPDYYHSTFHASWYIFEHWTKYFDIYAYIPNGSHTQDLVVLRHRADDEPQSRPVGHVGSRNEQNALSGRDFVAEPATDRQSLGRLSALKMCIREIESWDSFSNPQTQEPSRGRQSLKYGRPLKVCIRHPRTVIRRYRITRQPSKKLDLSEIRRELAMLRAGLYEQGSRISLITHELREEMAEDNRALRKRSS